MEALSDNALNWMASAECAKRLQVRDLIEYCLAVQTGMSDPAREVKNNTLHSEPGTIQKY